MNITFALAPALSLDGPPRGASPCIELSCADVSAPRSKALWVAAARMRRLFGARLRAFATRIRSEPSLSDQALDDTGMGELLRRR